MIYSEYQNKNRKLLLFMQFDDTCLNNSSNPKSLYASNSCILCIVEYTKCTESVLCNLYG